MILFNEQGLYVFTCFGIGKGFVNTAELIMRAELADIFMCFGM